MDYIELMVEETYKHLHENYPQADMATLPVISEIEEEINEYPAGPGILYHLQKSTSLFVIRTLVSQNIRQDYKKIIDHPEEYPSLDRKSVV